MTEIEQQQGLEPEPDAPDFRSELRAILNKHSMENGSDTPDFVLARYLTDCLRAFDTAVRARDDFYDRTSTRAAHAEDGERR